jgi:hypothetical protein
LPAVGAIEVFGGGNKTTFPAGTRLNMTQRRPAGQAARLPNPISRVTILACHSLQLVRKLLSGIYSIRHFIYQIPEFIIQG